MNLCLCVCVCARHTLAHWQRIKSSIDATAAQCGSVMFIWAVSFFVEEEEEKAAEIKHNPCFVVVVVVPSLLSFATFNAMPTFRGILIFEFS